MSLLEVDHDKLFELSKNDPELTLAARFWTASVQLEQDGQPLVFRFRDGILEAIGRQAEKYDVRIAGTRERWERLLVPTPAPGEDESMTAGVPETYADTEVAGLVFDGDTVTHIAPYGPAITRIFSLLREVLHGPPQNDDLDHYPFRDTDTAVGRYTYVEHGGVEYRVYYEEAGEGVPLLLQHTAGADARQWRHLLADPAMQQRFRMIAYDLPYHGRSLPPLTGPKWWQEQYTATKSDLLGWIVAIKRKLNLDRPLFMGVSMGGQLAPELLGHFPEDFRAAVGLNGWYHVDALSELTNKYFNHPQIHPAHFADLMYRMTSPVAPEVFRRECAWIYGSGGMGTYRGDNEYFFFGHDLRTDGHLVDTGRTPFYALSGEYDPTALIELGGGREIEANIPGAVYRELDGMSHFAMCDDPVRFNAALRPILEEAAASAAAIAEEAEMTR